MSPFREALLAFGHGEWAFLDGAIVRVARAEPLQLCDTRQRMATKSGTKRAPAKSAAKKPTRRSK